MNKQEVSNTFRDLENESFYLIYGGREMGKSASMIQALWNEILYKKYRTRISHRTHTRRKIWQRKK